MLGLLLGNKSVEKILLFLFVNEKCYGVQLHRLLKTPLTPIQKALLRLEKGGILASEYEGKTRLYRLNPAYPFLQELEPLLKKAYTLLTPDEKKRYYVPKQEAFFQELTGEKRKQILRICWQRLEGVRKLVFQAKTKAREETSGWNGKGEGEVNVVKEKENALIFIEKGSWRGKEGNEISFSNVFRWTLDIKSGVISLEHLRYGAEHPVFLFHLSPSGHQSLSSVDSHLCGGDIYFGQVLFESRSLRLNWRVIGPRKNEELDYYYT